MNKLEYLKTCKTYLRKVINYRRFLYRTYRSKTMTDEMIQNIKIIENCLGVVISSDSMFHMLLSHTFRGKVFSLIPENKQCWKNEYEELIETGFQFRFHEKEIVEA